MFLSSMRRLSGSSARRRSSAAPSVQTFDLAPSLVVDAAAVQAGLLPLDMIRTHRKNPPAPNIARHNALAKKLAKSSAAEQPRRTKKPSKARDPTPFELRLHEVGVHRAKSSLREHTCLCQPDGMHC